MESNKLRAQLHSGLNDVNEMNTAALYWLHHARRSLNVFVTVDLLYDDLFYFWGRKIVFRYSNGLALKASNLPTLRKKVEPKHMGVLLLTASMLELPRYMGP